MDITDVSLYQSTSSIKTPHHSKKHDNSTIWGSGESGYFTTPSSSELSSSKNFSNVIFTPVPNKTSSLNTFWCQPEETPKTGGIRLGKRASSLTESIDNHCANDSLLIPKEQSCGPIYYSNTEEISATDYIKEQYDSAIDENEHAINITQDSTYEETCSHQQGHYNFQKYFQSAFGTHPDILQKESLTFEKDFAKKAEESQLCVITNESKSCPVTPVKTKFLVKHSSFSPTSFNVDTVAVPRTPECFFSPMFQNQKEKSSLKKSSNKKIVKRLNLAVSEKNNILYSTRPVTPPKHKTPEKNKSSKRTTYSSAKKLYFKYDYSSHEKIDIIKLLGSEYPIPLQNILAYLSSEDLCKFCLVSKRWREICLTNAKINNRRLAYLDEKRRDKENFNFDILKKQSEPPNETSITQTTRKGFLEIQNNNSAPSTSQPTSRSIIRSPPVSPRRQKLNRFLQVGKQLEPRMRLRKCPKCAGPSKPVHKTPEYHCSAERCAYRFCELCMGPSHPGQSCPLSQTGLQAPSPPRPEMPPHRSDRIGSKRSKRNLRRL